MSQPETHLSLDTILTDGTHFARKTGQGVVEIINSVTGKLVAVMRSPDMKCEFEQNTMPNGETVYLEKGLPQSLLSFAGRGIVPYSPWLIDIICEKIATGSSLTKVCTEEGMPAYTVLSRWRRQYPQVEEMLENARRDRAEYMRDKALAEADVADEDNVQAQRLKHDAYKWGAAIDDPSKYSPKTKVDATISTPTMIVVQTGIDRSVDRDVTPSIIDEKDKLPTGEK